MSQNQRLKKSFINSFHDRSNDRKSLPNQFKYEYASIEYVDVLISKIEHLEKEAIHSNKILTEYFERIKQLEIKVTRLETENKKERIANVINKHNTVTNTASVPSRNDISTRTDILTSDLIIPGKISGWLKFTNLFKHRPSLDSLKKKNIYKNEVCFDTELENVIKHERYPTVPKIIVECVQIIEKKIKNCPTSDGLYRMSGNHADIQKIRYLIDNNDYDCLKTITDINTLAGVLKLFLREIKNPLVKITEIRTFIGSDKDWTQGNPTYKIETLKKLAKSLPEQNRDTLCYLFNHLYRLTHKPLQIVNVRSLAVSLTPTIFHFASCDKADLHTTIKESELLASCLEIFIEHQDQIFETVTKPISKILSRCISYPCLLGIRT